MRTRSKDPPRTAPPPGGPPATPPATALARGRWFSSLWVLQLIPWLALAAFALWRIRAGAASGAETPNASFALVLAVLWIAFSLVMIALTRARAWLIRFRVELALSATVIALCTVVADFSLNVLGLVPTIAEQRAQSVAYTFGRFTDKRLVVKDIVLREQPSIPINSRGFRGPEFPVAKDPARPRIVFLGGSHVFDFVGGGWPEMAGRVLAARGHDVEVINAAVPGHRTFDSLGKLISDVWTLEPDVIFLCHAWNDIKYFPTLSPAAPFRGLPPAEAQSWHRDWRLYPSGIDRVLSVSALYRMVRWRVAGFLYDVEGGRKMAPTPAPRSTGLGPWGPRQFYLNTALIADLAKRTGATLVLCKQSRLVTDPGTADEAALDYTGRLLRMPVETVMEAFEAAYDAVAEVAAEYDLEVVDMHRALSGRRAYFADGIHFNPAGSREAAKLVARALEPLVRAPSDLATTGR